MREVPCCAPVGRIEWRLIFTPVKNALYFVSLCAIGTLMVALAVAPLGFFLSHEESIAAIQSDSAKILGGAGMIAGYVAWLLAVFFLLSLAATRIPFCRRALRWYASERRRARLLRSGRASEVPHEGRRRGIPTMSGVVTRRRIVMKIKTPPGW